MRVPIKYDVIILGGGCAGLSLAMRLADYGEQCPKVLIIEPRAQYTNDRTWCFWDDGEVPFGASANYHWQKMLVSDNNKILDLDCQSFSYCMLAADNFYQTSLNTISKNKAIILLLQQQVVSKKDLDDGYWQIKTDVETFTGKIIIDTRPQYQATTSGVILWQSFLGHEILCDDEVFDPTRVVLMDFLPPHPNNLRFTYVLPLSTRRALIESTVFAVKPMNSDDLIEDNNVAIKKYTKQRDYKIIRTEHGVLPMGIQMDKSSDVKKNYVKVGLTAGGARSSSGYAFQRIQTWAKVSAENIIQHGYALGHPGDPFIQSFMDKLFLVILRANLQQGSKIFMSLFSKAHTESIIRFLSDRGSLIDCARVIAALPKKPFMKHLWRLAWHK